MQCAKKKEKCSNQHQQKRRWIGWAVCRMRSFAVFCLLWQPKKQFLPAFYRSVGLIYGSLFPISTSPRSESKTLYPTPILSHLCTSFCSLEKPIILISSTLSTYAFNTVILILLIILGFPILRNGSTLLLNAKEDSTIFISVLMLTIIITLMMIVTGNFPNCQHLFSHGQLLLLLTSTASLSKASLFLRLDLDFHHSKLFRCNALNSMNFEISYWY